MRYMCVHVYIQHCVWSIILKVCIHCLFSCTNIEFNYCYKHWRKCIVLEWGRWEIIKQTNQWFAWKYNRLTGALHQMAWSTKLLWDMTWGWDLHQARVQDTQRWKTEQMADLVLWGEPSITPTLYRKTRTHRRAKWLVWGSTVRKWHNQPHIRLAVPPREGTPGSSGRQVRSASLTPLPSLPTSKPLRGKGGVCVSLTSANLAASIALDRMRN